MTTLTGLLVDAFVLVGLYAAAAVLCFAIADAILDICDAVARRTMRNRDR